MRIYTILLAESKGIKEPLDECERREWKSWLKLQYSKNEIMESGPITSWQIDGGKRRSRDRLYFLGSKITVNSDLSHGIKRCMLGKKTMTTLDHVLKSKDITLSAKVHIVRATVFPVVIWMWELDHKEDDHWRIYALKLWCWRRLLRDSWTARDQTSQSWKILILNINWKDSCWNSNTLATWCKELAHWKRSWCLERLKAKGEGGDRGKDA